jgi:hypothetical protein
MGGIVRVASNRMRRYIEFERARSGSQKGWEWFQWLSEQLERYGSGETNLLRGAPRSLSRPEADALGQIFANHLTNR